MHVSWNPYQFSSTRPWTNQSTSVSVIDLNKRAVLGTIPIGVTSDGAAYVN
jgi:hypothetical protein